MPVLTVLLLLNLLALLVLLFRHVRLRREVDALRLRADGLAGAASVPPALATLAGTNTQVIVITILNPMELAAQKHWVAGTMARLTPGLVRKIVYQEALKIVSNELPKYGVVAEVRIVGNA